MERQGSNPEYKRKDLFDDCSGCEKRYKLTPQTVIDARFFSEQPECNSILLDCPHCHYKTKLFVSGETQAQLALNGIVAKEFKMADPETMKQWMDTYGIPMIGEYEITQRHERIVENFGHTTVAILDQAPDLFWDEINSPHTDKPYPQRWT